MKQINIENRPYYFSNEMIDIKDFDPNLLSLGKISFKSTDVVIYNIKYITMKSLDHVNIDCANPLYLIFNNLDGYIEESNEDTYLIFTSTGKNKKVLENYKELWDKIKNQIETITGGELIEYKTDFMKIGFKSNDDLPLGKILSIPSMIIVTGSVLQEDNKYYPQVCLHECLYESVNEL